MKLAKDIYLFLISRIIIFSINLLGFLFLVRELGAAIVGSYYLFTPVMRLLYQGTSLGIGKSVTKITSEQERSYALSGFVLMIPILVIISTPILIFQESLSNYIGYYKAPLYLIVSIWLSSISESLLASLKGKNRVGSSGILDASGKTIEVLSQISLVVIGLGLEALFIGIVTGYMFRILIFSLQISSKEALPTKNNLMKLIGFSKSSYFDSIISGKPLWVDLIIIGLFLEKTSAGIYGTIWKIGFAVIMFSESIGESLFPKISTYEGKKAVLIRKSLVNSTLIGIPFLLGSIAIGEQVLILIGDAFSNQALVLIGVAASSLGLSVHNNLVYIIYGDGSPNISLKIHSLGIFLNIVLSLLLVQTHGTYGVVLGSLSSTFVILILSFEHLRKKYSVRTPIRSWLYQVFASLVMFTVVILSKNTINVGENKFALLGVVFIGVTSYSLIVWMFSKAEVDTDFLWNNWIK
jgi:O-antigen/teichoic acid export membrane protein